MSGVLFLGSSHVAALKLAHQEIDPDNALGCAFACARGADLAFTKVEGGLLKASDSADYDAETIAYAFPGWLEAQYVAENRPTEDVGPQFLKTHGAEAVDITRYATIFHVLGSSPYDFSRLNESVMPVSAPLRRRLLGRMLADKHLLRRQIGEMRACNPDCAHHLIAMPLKAILRAKPSDEDVQTVRSNRETVQRYAGNHLFDDVYMPDEELLDASLLSTRVDFTPGGCAKAELFQKVAAPIDTDRQHMNSTYGQAVFEAFVRPRLPLSVTAGAWPRP